MVGREKGMKLEISKTCKFTRKISGRLWHCFSVVRIDKDLMMKVDLKWTFVLQLISKRSTKAQFTYSLKAKYKGIILTTLSYVECRLLEQFQYVECNKSSWILWLRYWHLEVKNNFIHLAKFATCIMKNKKKFQGFLIQLNCLSGETSNMTAYQSSNKINLQILCS